MDKKDFDKYFKEAHNELSLELSSIIDILNNGNKPNLSDIQSIIKSASSFYTNFENDLISFSKDRNLTDAQLKDILTSIENVLRFSISYWDIIGQISNKYTHVKHSPPKNFLKTAQSILRTYNKKSANNMKNNFKKHNLPIDGFISKDKYFLTQKFFDCKLFIAGISILLAAIMLEYYGLVDNGNKYLIFRIFVAFGCSLLYCSRGDKLSLKTEIANTKIKTSGAIAMFVLVYLVNPASKPSIENYNDKINNNIININNSNNNSINIQQNNFRKNLAN